MEVVAVIATLVATINATRGLLRLIKLFIEERIEEQCIVATVLKKGDVMTDKEGSSGPKETISLTGFVERIMAGEKIFIQVAQLAAFIVHTEELRLSYTIKTSVVGGQIILERWDCGEAANLERRDVNKLTYH